MDLQKIATYGSAAAVVSTGAVVGGISAVDSVKGGPEKREVARMEEVRIIVAEEVYRQLSNTFPKITGPVTGAKDPTLDYRQTIPKR